MPLNPNVTKDYQYVDFVAQVTLTGKRATGNLSKVIDNALPQPVFVQEQTTGRWVPVHDRKKWQLWADQLTFDPLPGDTITHGTDVWTIEQATKDQGTGKWECDTVKEVT